MGYTLCIKEQKIVCHGHEYTDVRGIRGSVYLYDIPAETGSIVVGPNIYRIYYAAMMGQNLLFAGTKGNHDSNENPTFYTLNLSSKEVSELCYPDHYIGGLGIRLRLPLWNRHHQSVFRRQHILHLRTFLNPVTCFK